MEQIGMRKKIELTRRHFVGATASTIAVAPFVRIKPATAQSTEADPPAIPSRQDVTSKTFGLLRQIEAGDLSIGYVDTGPADGRSEEHTSELQSLMRHSYDVSCLKKKKKILTITYK